MLIRSKCVQVLAAVFLAGGLGACQSPQVQPNANTQTTGPIAEQAATVVKVNAELAYVILEVAQLPQAGQEVDLKRMGKSVSRVRISERVEMPFVVADILSGSPRAGDAVILAPANSRKVP